MPEISFVYILEAILNGSWTLFACWIAASVMGGCLTGITKSILRRHRFSKGTHLLYQLHRRQTFNAIGIIVCAIAIIWNARHLWSNPYLHIALAAELLLGLYAIKHLWKIHSSTEAGTICFAATIVLAISPVAISPVILLSSCHIIYDKSEWKRLLPGLTVLPALALICARIIREPWQWSGLIEVTLLTSLAICIYFIIKYRKVIQSYRNRLNIKESERMLERRRMDELELNIIKSERENLLNMLDIRRREVLENAEKITDQSQFMQDIYESICKAQREEEPERSTLLQEMKSKIQLRMNFTDERTNFAQQVEDLHKDFNIRLQARFPDLSTQERKLAAMLRLEFPTKYIAATLNISPKSVEIERYRLRKKFGLDRRTKLTEFVKTI